MLKPGENQKVLVMIFQGQKGQDIENTLLTYCHHSSVVKISLTNGTHGIKYTARNSELCEVQR